MCDHDWREASNGRVAPDAVRGGVDKSGETLYIGRAYHEGDILPAKIVPSHGRAYVAWGGREIIKTEYSVLCCPAHRITWVAEANGGVPHHAFSIGATNIGEPLYIGRVLHDGTLTPGKVHGSHGCCYIPYAGKEFSHKEYEVLVIR